MATLGQSQNGNHVPIKYSELADDEKLDILVGQFINQANYKLSIGNITTNWEKLTREQESHLEDLLIASDLFTIFRETYSPMFKIKERERINVMKMGSYSKYAESLNNKLKIYQEKGNLETTNLRLSNEILTFQVSTKMLEKDLKNAQYQLINLQAKELKKRKVWAVLGALGGAILTLIISYATKRI